MNAGRDYSYRKPSETHVACVGGSAPGDSRFVFTPRSTDAELKSAGDRTAEWGGKKKEGRKEEGKKRSNSRLAEIICASRIPAVFSLYNINTVSRTRRAVHTLHKLTKPANNRAGQIYTAT
jgi:hypothetical protein